MRCGSGKELVVEPATLFPPDGECDIPLMGLFRYSLEASCYRWG